MVDSVCYFFFFLLLFHFLGKAEAEKKNVLFGFIPCKEVMTCCCSKQERIPLHVFVVRDKAGDTFVSLRKGLTVKTAGFTGNAAEIGGFPLVVNLVEINISF